MENRKYEEYLSGKKVAVIGYGAQGCAQANCMKDSGLEVVVGLRKESKSWEKAMREGFEVYTTREAAEMGDIVHMLVPDELAAAIYENDIRQSIAGKTLCFSHGFNIVFGMIVPPKDVDVIMVAPKSPGTEERKQYLAGFGVPALVAVKQDYSGDAMKTAMAMADAMGFTKAGVLECTFEQETYEDLFGEQCVLCGGLVELMKAGFETLVEAGYPPKMAYFECVHEMKLIVDLIYEGGIKKMAEVVSNTAEYGMWSTGKKIVGPEVKEKMKDALRYIESGGFADEFTSDHKKGFAFLKKSRDDIAAHEIEKTGEAVRSMFRR